MVNSLAASFLVFPRNVLYTPENIIKETDNIFCELLRNAKVNKIVRNTMIKETIKDDSKYQINCSLIDHLRVRHAIPGLWRHILELPKNELHSVQTCQPTSPYI